MTDKQIIIDGVDVSGCSWYTQGATGMICADWHISNDCSKNPNCNYKQLKRLEKLLSDINGKYYKAVDDLKAKEQECEKLRFPMKDTNYAILTKEEFEKFEQLKQTLTEIKEMCKEEKGWVNCSDMKLTETAQFAQQIFDKISKVEE